jgi:hypothetical protein
MNDDLGAVRNSDPVAADRISNYCKQAAAANPNTSSREAACRLQETAAWARLFQSHEFPQLDDNLIRECTSPPFPGDFVGEESCARYKLLVRQ